MLYNGNGGSIYFYVSNGNLLIESSTFINCTLQSTSSTIDVYGAAIYVGNGNTVLHNVCGSDCYSSSYSGFANIELYSTSYTMNYVIESSIANCVALNYYTMYHYRANIQYKSVNLSNNNAYRYSAIRCYPNQKDGNGIATSISILLLFLLCIVFYILYSVYIYCSLYIMFDMLISY